MVNVVDEEHDVQLSRVPVVGEESVTDAAATTTPVPVDLPRPPVADVENTDAPENVGEIVENALHRQDLHARRIGSVRVQIEPIEPEDEDEWGSFVVTLSRVPHRGELIRTRSGSEFEVSRVLHVEQSEAFVSAFVGAWRIHWPAD